MEEAMAAVRRAFETGEGLEPGQAVYGFTHGDVAYILRIPVEARGPLRLIDFHGLRLMVGPDDNAATIVEERG